MRLSWSAFWYSRSRRVVVQQEVGVTQVQVDAALRLRVLHAVVRRQGLLVEGNVRLPEEPRENRLKVFSFLPSYSRRRRSTYWLIQPWSRYGSTYVSSMKSAQAIWSTEFLEILKKVFQVPPELSFFGAKLATPSFA